jgi:hypothetical protein
MHRVGENEVRGLSGARARLWGFTPSHDRLVIEITFPSGNRSYLQCVMCDRICVPMMWRWNNPKLARTGDLLHVKDEEVDIHCEELWLQATAELDGR